MDGLFLVDVPRSGAQNMAMDQRMLEQASEREQPLLRIYQWARPTLSLGYFQKYAERLTHKASNEIDVVRRSTGGGAIVHHHDWTYSLAVPNRLLSRAQASEALPLVGDSRKQNRFDVGASLALYDCVHQTVVQWLAEQGLQGRLWNGNCAAGQGEKAVVARADKCSFLCFERRSAGDVVVGDCKVLGSAQRRWQGALLQHGSLLLMRSCLAPSLPGIQELGASDSCQTLGPRDFGLRIRAAIAALTRRALVEVASAQELLPRWHNDPSSNFSKTTWVGRR